MTRPGRRGDRGAVGAIVAVLFGTGVALGMCALVIDIGLIFVERKQLQTGADAAAVEVARVCATSAVACGAPGTTATAAAYARENVADGEATAAVCGRGGGLSPCPTPSACARPAPATGVYAEVRTSILRPDGSTLLPPVFAQAVVDDYDGAAVTACARATWGPPRAARTLALAVSACDWEAMTGRGARFPSRERTLGGYPDTDPGACGRGAGSAGAGGFRWVAGSDATCRTPVSTTTAFRVTGRTELPAGCRNVLETLPPGQAVAVPIFSAVSDAGSAYTVLGVAAFVVTGWRLPGSRSTRAPAACGAGGCVSGYFTRAQVPGGGTVGGPNLGAQITELIG
ncbi:Putative Flp pilus-assembly TadE/G-like [Asanoa hainanensis]|uniref:Putative Flp pilus-assembly TadE/G-like n=1 Tax=Asanoa hainanensis TaxID=560556 RepID=A0A239NIU7_9ACTN|nr:Putative Flp pilus-assembly TadE/G-like [Asanoa hainanensis]